MGAKRRGSSNPPDFPILRAGLLLCAAVAAIGFASTWLLREEPSAADRPFTPAPRAAPPTATDPPGVFPAPPAASALLDHAERVAPVFDLISAGQDQRSLDALSRAHGTLLQELETIPPIPPDASADDRDLYLSYEAMLHAIEDGVNDLLEGIVEDDPMEWNEGVREFRLARARFEALVERIDASR